MTPEVVQFIASCLDEDERERVKKQQHTARRIYERLVDEKGFASSEYSVRNLVHDMRAARKETKAFVPLRFAPGEAVQIDWGEATVYLNGKKMVVNLFCARLCHSYALYVIAYKRQNLESFLDAMIHTFQYYGGVPRRVIFDNERVADKSGFGSMQQHKTTTASSLCITALSLYFAIRLPETRKAWSKILYVISGVMFVYHCPR